MQKLVMYRYIGYNGTIDSTVQLDCPNTLKIMRIRADAGKILTDGVTKSSMVSVPLVEADNWYEIPIQGQE